VPFFKTINDRFVTKIHSPSLRFVVIAINEACLQTCALLHVELFFLSINCRNVEVVLLMPLVYLNKHFCVVSHPVTTMSSQYFSST